MTAKNFHPTFRKNFLERSFYNAFGDLWGTDQVHDRSEIDELVITGEPVKLSWEEKAKRAEEYSASIEQGKKILVDLSTQKPEIDDWIAKNKKKLETLLRPIVIDLFNAEKVIKE